MIRSLNHNNVTAGSDDLPDAFMVALFPHYASAKFIRHGLPAYGTAETANIIPISSHEVKFLHA